MNGFQSDFSSISSRPISEYEIPLDQNNIDIQSAFQSESSINTTPLHFYNTVYNNNTNLIKKEQYKNKNIENSDDSSEDFESGYSHEFTKNKLFTEYDEDMEDNENENNNYKFNKIEKPKNNNIITPIKSNNYPHTYYSSYTTPKKYYQNPIKIMNFSPIKYNFNINSNSQTSPYLGFPNFNNLYLPNQNYNYSNSNYQINSPSMNIYNNQLIQQNNYYYPINKNLPQEEPIPQDTIIEAKIGKENKNLEKNNPVEEEYKNKIKKLYEQCRKKGTPPADDDFSLEGWKLFYPEKENFFLWKKGPTIPNQLRINNENDEEKLEIYEGEVNKDDEKHGYGIMTTPYYVRKGTWRFGEFTGWNRESRVNGDILEGKFIDGALFGKGINKTRKGNLYFGDFVDNKREGIGELRTKRIHYVGEFKLNKFNGKGKIKFLKEGHSYEGNFVNNEISGKGIFKWSNGEIYEGEMTNGIMNGYGKYIYSNGQIYEGNYVNGVKEGVGKLTYPGNKIFKGEFKKGSPEGFGYLYSNGKKMEVVYENGKFRKTLDFL